MMILLSPAKSLDYDTPVPADLPHTRPQFVAQSQQLIEILRQKSPQDIASLMKISDPLAALNVARYQAWSSRFSARNARQALLAFNGDVYEGLDARTLAAEDLAWAQQRNQRARLRHKLRRGGAGSDTIGQRCGVVQRFRGGEQYQHGRCGTKASAKLFKKVSC